MTLILALASRHRVLLVSDRQLTDIDPVTKERTPHPSPATKSVMFENRAIFGYTGYSLLEGLSADLWIAETISQVRDGNIMHAFALICEGLNRIFRSLQSSDDILYHAVLASSRLGFAHSLTAPGRLSTRALPTPAPGRSLREPSPSKSTTFLQDV